MSSFFTPLSYDNPSINDVKEELQFCVDLLQIHYTVVPLYQPKDVQKQCAERCVSYTDRSLSTRDWSTRFIGKISDWIDLDHPLPKAQLTHEEEFSKQLLWANHLGLRSVLLPTPHSNCTIAYSRGILQYIGRLFPQQTQQIVINIPLVLPFSPRYNHDTSNNGNTWSGWHIWNQLKEECDYNPRIHVALSITEDVHEFYKLIKSPEQLSDLAEEEYISNWFSILRWGVESVKQVIIPTELFVMNDAEFPVLPKALQMIVRLFIRNFAGIMITGDSYHSTESLAPYFQYIRHLQQTEERVVANSHADSYCRPYWDILQIPLQPLMDHLEAQTYETFEEDNKKYEQYEEAIVAALQHIQKRNNHSDSNIDEMEEDVEKSYDRIEVMVVGAGRGPLVAATLSAASRCGVYVTVHAVEKNPNAIVTLRNRHIQERWGDNYAGYKPEDGDNTSITGNIVYIIESDMRALKLTTRPELIISELLGSFGDNELSPECLDGVYRRVQEYDAQSIQLVPSNGMKMQRPPAPPGLQVVHQIEETIPISLPPVISIPEQYASYLQPISCPQLWTMARDITPTTVAVHNNSHIINSNSVSSMTNNHGHCYGLECLYVVKLHRFFALSEQIEMAWEFQHPPEENLPAGENYSHNKRYAVLHFTCTTSGICHGFAGYFTSVLFQDVTLSIHPSIDTTPNMHSWFPCYLPILHPIEVRQGQVITLHLWRCMDKYRIWYEWSMTTSSSVRHHPSSSIIHNLHGRAYSVGL